MDIDFDFENTLEEDPNAPPFKVVDSVAAATSTVSAKVSELYRQAMAPLDSLIASIASLYHSFVASLAVALVRMMDTVKQGVWTAYQQTVGGMAALLAILKKNVVDRVVLFATQAYAKAAEGVKFAVSKLEILIASAIGQLRTLFGGIVSVVGNILRTIFSGIGGLGFFAFAATVDGLTRPIKVPVTVKVNMVLGILAYILLAPYKDVILSRPTFYIAGGCAAVTIAGLVSSALSPSTHTSSPAATDTTGSERAAIPAPPSATSAVKEYSSF